ncbi:MAG: XRE family transcriptional regulator [Pseudomonadota bacterium]
MTVANHVGHAADAATVLSKAVKRASERLGISQATLAKVIGLSPATVSRLFNGEYLLDRNSKQWEFAVLFIRIFRSLDSIVGNEETARRWIRGENPGLNGRPIELMEHAEGLVRIAHYLDASRGTI